MTGRRSAFTLVELLVVIVIIGILMALLFPAVVNALRSAGETQCQGHLGQLAKVMQAYCSDHDGQFPLWAERRSAASADNWLYIGSSDKNFAEGLLRDGNYIGDESILFCPLDVQRGLARPNTALLWQRNTSSDKRKKAFDSVRLLLGLSDDVTKFAPTSYVINAGVTWGDYPWTGNNISKIRSRNISDFDATDFLFIEQSAGVDPEPPSKFDRGCMVPNASSYALTNRHRGGGFVACMGGSVERISTEKFDESMDGFSGPRLGQKDDWSTDKFDADETEGRWNPR